MRNHPLLILLALGQALIALIPVRLAAQDWTHDVRIGGYGLSLDRVDSIVQNATEAHVFGIETDNDVPGRYESFLDPTAKLQAIHAVAEKAHAAGNFAFVYIAGLECITAHADRVPHTMFKDHPDWVQRNLRGDPAVFGGGAAFWIRSGDEDVWISPFAPAWREVYMERVRQIAATGIDGVYVDIPYWMTHFDNWENTWASFDDYTVAAFKQKTGLDARKDVKLGDYSDPGFIKWIDFRIQAITDFMAEIDRNVKSVNPRCKTIAEIYPGIEESAPRVGADVYSLYPVIDAICHEYEYGHGNHMAASRRPLDWFGYMTGMLAFRAFAGSKPTWILNYSWENQKKIEPREAMENLFVSELMAGANIYDARGHVMSGSNDMATRTKVFGWVARHEKTFYSPRRPIQPMGVYFSPHTRDHFPQEFVRAFRGVMFLLLQSHREFQVVTPRTLHDFTSRALILPDVKCLSRGEVDWLRSYWRSGNTLIVTGETGKYDEERKPQATNPVLKLLGVTDPARKRTGTYPREFIYEPQSPGDAYYSALEKEFNDVALSGDYQNASFNQLRENFLKEIDAASGLKPVVEIHASPFVSTQIAKVNGNVSAFLANFKGLKSNEVATPTPETNVRIDFLADSGRADSGGKVYVLPFLGDVQELKCSSPAPRRKACVIPEIDKGMVVWLAPSR